MSLVNRSKTQSRDVPLTMQRKSRTICLNCGAEISKRINRYCNNRCQSEYQYRAYIERWKQGLETGLARGFNLSNHIRRYMLEKYGTACPRCQWSEQHPISGKVPLTIDHIDGDWQNCAEENLRILCPNCHALTPNYGMLNKGRGRKGRHSGGLAQLGERLHGMQEVSSSILLSSTIQKPAVTEL